MISVLLIALTVVLYSFQTLFCRLYNNASAGRADVQPFVYCVYYGVFVALATYLAGACGFSPSGTTVLYGLLNGATLLLYNFALIKATDTGSYSIANLSLLSGGILIPLALSVAVYGDQLSVYQYAGVAVMLASFVLLNADGLFVKKREKASRAGRLFPVYCALLFLANGAYGTFFNAQQRALDSLERGEMIIITFLFTAILGLMYVILKCGKAAPKMFRLNGRSALYLMVCCASAALAVNLLVYIMSLVNVAVLYTADNGGVLMLSVLYATFLFKEKLTSCKTAGLMAALASLILLGFGTV